MSASIGALIKEYGIDIIGDSRVSLEEMREAGLGKAIDGVVPVSIELWNALIDRLVEIDGGKIL